jgi:hypothetical protein
VRWKQSRTAIIIVELDSQNFTHKFTNCSTVKRGNSLFLYEKTIFYEGIYLAV